MPDQFDPYYRWLSIPPEEQPPNHYRLLGLKVREADADVIESAADRQMSHVRTFQSGKFADLSQRMLNEISAAKITLLDPAKKSAYDATLPSTVVPVAGDSPPAKQRLLPVAKKLPPAAVDAPLPPAVQPPTVAPPTLTPAAERFAPAKSTVSVAARRKRSGLSLGAAMALVALLVVGLASLAAVLLIVRPWNAATPVAVAPPDDESLSPPSDIQPPADSPPVVTPPVKPPKKPTKKPPKKPAKNPPAHEPADEPLPEEKTSPDPPEEPLETEPIDEAPPLEPIVPQRSPVPAKAERDAQRAKIDAIFQTANAKSPAEKADLAAEIYRVAGETPDDPVGQFVMLNLTRELAADAARMRLAFDAIALLEQQFEFDADAVRIATIAQGAKALVPNEAKVEVVTHGIALADKLAAADRYDDAGRLLSGLIELARRARDNQVAADLVERRRVNDTLAKAFAAAQSSLTTLKTSPDDPAANLAAGRYYLLVKNARRGLTHLAKGSDKLLAAAAELELTDPQTPDEQEKLADAWWDIAAGELDKDLKARLQSRAMAWYQRAQPELKGLAAAKADKRLHELADAGVQPADIHLDLGVFDDDPRSSATAARLPANLLNLVDPAIHALSQKWTRDGSDIIAPKSFAALLKIPATIDGSYDATLEFTRTEGDDIVGLVFPVGQTQCEVMLSAAGGDLGGLAQIDGKSLGESPAKVSPCRLTNGQRYALRARVALRGDQTAIDITLDGKPLLRWEGAVSSLSVGSHRDVRAPQHFGLYANDTQVSFHSLKLLMLTGRATPDADARRVPTRNTRAEAANNLLSKIDTTRDSVKGEWKLVDGILRSPGDPWARLRIPVTPPAEYQVELIVEPTHDVNKAIVMGLIAPGPQKVLVTVDGWDGFKFSGIEWIDGRPSKENETTGDTPLLTPHKRNRIVYTVRKTGLSLEVNEREVFDWRGDFGRIKADQGWDIPDADRLFIGTFQSEMLIHSLILRPLAVTQSQVPRDVTRGLVAHWKFDEGLGGVARDAVGRHNGAVHGATWVEGQLGGALRFDGTDDAVVIGNHQALNFAGQITLAAWVRPASLPEKRQADAGTQCIVAHVGTKEEVYLRMHFDGAPVYEGGRWHKGAKPAAHVRAEQEDIGRWVHLAATFEGNAWQLFRNGQPVGSSKQAFGAIGTDGTWTIGAYDGSKRYFHGDIDDVRIYNRGLSADEVKTLYLGRSSIASVPRVDPRPPSKVVDTGLVAHWNFDEGRGTAARDAVSGENATVDSATWVEGKIGGALRFDGKTAHVAIADREALRLDGPSTLAAWIRPARIPQGITFMNVIAHGGAQGRGETYLRLCNSQYAVGDFIGRHDPTEKRVPDEDVGQWVHLAGVYDGESWHIYRNGERFHSRKTSEGPRAFTGPWAIGSAFNYKERFFEGDIDDVRIYRRALTDDELQALATAGEASPAERALSPQLPHADREQLPPAALPLRVVITRAVYGAGDRTTDVTAALRQHLSDDPFAPLQADDRAFGDPAEGQQKELAIVYEIAGRSAAARLNQQQVLVLPPLPIAGMAVKDASKKFHILAARYGAGLTWLDVTAAAREKATSPEEPIAWSLTSEDPWFGITKHVCVWFDYQGKRYVRILGDGETKALLP